MLNNFFTDLFRFLFQGHKLYVESFLSVIHVHHVLFNLFYLFVHFLFILLCFLKSVLHVLNCTHTHIFALLAKSNVASINIITSLSSSRTFLFSYYYFTISSSSSWVSAFSSWNTEVSSSLVIWVYGKSFCCIFIYSVIKCFSVCFFDSFYFVSLFVCLFLAIFWIDPLLIPNESGEIFLNQLSLKGWSWKQAGKRVLQVSRESLWLHVKSNSGFCQTV